MNGKVNCTKPPAKSCLPIIEAPKQAESTLNDLDAVQQSPVLCSRIDKRSWLKEESV